MKNDALLAAMVRRRRCYRAVTGVIGFVLLAALVSASAIVTKEAIWRSKLAPLAAISEVPLSDAPTAALPETAAESDIVDPLADAAPSSAAKDEYVSDTSIRFFNGRPVRPARTMWMTVTAYSPDSRSCGDSADGITSSIHSVYTNGMKLAAADTRILPLGSMISVPGYDDGHVIPVLDRGGAIKGKRLDMLYPTHEIARKWGVQRLQVTVWEYADGKPAGDFRKFRDSK